VPNPSSHLTLISAEKINPEDTSRISRRYFGRHAAVAAAFALYPGWRSGHPKVRPRNQSNCPKFPIAASPV
jgi:hypothetical protein